MPNFNVLGFNYKFRPTYDTVQRNGHNGEKGTLVWSAFALP